MSTFYLFTTQHKCFNGGEQKDCVFLEAGRFNLLMLHQQNVTPTVDAGLQIENGLLSKIKNK